MIKPLIIEALEDIGPCDVETLSGHMGQSESMINSLLVNYMRKGMVRCVNPDAAQFVPRAYELTDKARREYDNGEGVIGKTDLAPLCSEERATSKASAVTVQAGESSCEQEVKPVTTPAALPTITEIVTVPSSPISKVEQLRRAMQSDGGEMYVSELAEESGIPARNIPGLLQNDVRIGQVHLRKEEGKSVYRWIGGADRTALTTGDRQHLTRASKGTKDITEGADRQGVDSTLVSEVESVAATQPETASTDFANGADFVNQTALTEISQQMGFISVPSSSLLTSELFELDSELIAVNSRLTDLMAKRAHKGSLLLIVQKLEELMKGQTA